MFHKCPRVGQQIAQTCCALQKTANIWQHGKHEERSNVMGKGFPPLETRYDVHTLNMYNSSEADVAGTELFILDERQHS